MLKAGAMRTCSRPFSPDIVVVRIKYGSIRICVDVNNLHNKTINDAKDEDTLHLLAGSIYSLSLTFEADIDLREQDKQ